MIRVIVADDVASLVHAINRYMVYGMISPSRARLHLWVDHNVERRTERAHGQSVIPFVSGVGRMLERIPLVREFAGSLHIRATRPE